MDQLRTALAWLKQHHFWVLTGLVALIGLGSWWSAASTLSSQYEENEKKITAEFNSVAALRSNPFHPNERIKEKQAEQIEEIRTRVAAVWEKLYERQREQVLKWPAALSEAFRKHVENLEFGGDIPSHLRQNYQDYVELYFPKLPEKIGARVLAPGEGPLGGSAEFMGRRSYPGEGGFAMPSGTLEEDEGDYIVEWLDQAHVREELDFPQRPSALRIWWTQENLWVYETLLNVIRNTNEAAGATRMSNAAVRTIYSLEVGRNAAQGSQSSRTKDRIYKPPTAAAAPGGELGMGEYMPEGGGEMPGELAGEPGGLGPESFREGSFAPGGAMSPAQEQQYLLSGRYLDEQGLPISAGGGMAGEMGGEIGGEFADPSIPAPQVDLSMFGKEYRRLPVRMVLHMDQRWLPELISECASQPLQVEVKEVRINPADGGGMQGRGFGEGYGGGYGGGMGGSQFPDRSGLLTFPQQPHMVDVVIQGVIFILRKPDPNVLKSPEEAAADPMAGL
jgi:hypothetical protein